MPFCSAEPPLPLRIQRARPKPQGSCWGGVSRLFAQPQKPRTPLPHPMRPTTRADGSEQLESDGAYGAEPMACSEEEARGAAPAAALESILSSALEPMKEMAPTDGVDPGERRSKMSATERAEVNERREYCPKLRDNLMEFVVTVIIVLWQAVALNGHSSNFLDAAFVGNPLDMNGTCSHMFMVAYWSMILMGFACLAELVTFVLIGVILEDNISSIFHFMGYPLVGFSQGLSGCVRATIAAWTFGALVSVYAVDRHQCTALSTSLIVTCVGYGGLTLKNAWKLLAGWMQDADAESTHLLRKTSFKVINGF